MIAWRFRIYNVRGLSWVLEIYIVIIMSLHNALHIMSVFLSIHSFSPLNNVWDTLLCLSTGGASGPHQVSEFAKVSWLESVKAEFEPEASDSSQCSFYSTTPASLVHENAVSFTHRTGCQPLTGMNVLWVLGKWDCIHTGSARSSSRHHNPQDRTT